MMRALDRLPRLALVVGLVAVHGAPARAQTTLRYKFKQGERFRCVTEMETQTQMTLGGKDFTTKSAFTFDVTWTVTAVGSDGTAKVAQTLDRIRYLQDGPQGKSAFDSEKTEEPTDPLGKVMVPLYKAMVGAEFKVTMSPQGEVSDVRLPRKVVEALKSMPGGKLVQEALKDFTGPGGLRLSKHPVKPGGSWNTKVEMKMEPIGKLFMDTKYTYEGKGEGDRKNLERIALHPTLAADVVPGSAQNVKFTKQEGKGIAYLDNEKGRLVEASLVLKMELDVSSDGQTVPVKLMQTNRTKLVPVHAPKPLDADAAAEELRTLEGIWETGPKAVTRWKVLVALVRDGERVADARLAIEVGPKPKIKHR
jgi:hypothetical protein